MLTTWRIASNSESGGKYIVVDDWNYSLGSGRVRWFAIVQFLGEKEQRKKEKILSRMPQNNILNNLFSMYS